MDSQKVPDLQDSNARNVPAVDAAATKASPSTGFTRLQLIDDEQQFSAKLPEFMQEKWDLWNAGFDYNVVAVFGSQSTGKSTLLNRLFGTKFDVMNEEQRRQTTRGIWADRGTDAMPVLILDVEGTDGRERGENQDFERKSALFSLAIAEVLIVNMWENMVGLYNGANMGLLKTVLEVNLQLFGSNKENKTLLYFVIRDHVSPTPLDNLSNTLANDLEKIWNSLNKPEELKDAKLSDYFDLKFTSLPHKLLQPENFESSALKLRSQFTDKKESGYVFKAGYKRRVPADGFPHYAEAVWEKVVSNKDLDLPTQQELLAQYRCDEIAQTALGPFRQTVDQLRPRVQDGEIVDDLGPLSKEARLKAIETFDAQAARYHADVYKKKRAVFVQTLNGELQSVFLNQVKNSLSKAADTFANKCHKELDEANDDVELDSMDYSFAKIVGNIREQVTKWFTGIVELLVIDDGDGAAWSFASEIKQLGAMLDATTAKLRLEEMERILEFIRRKVRDDLSEIIADKLNNPDAEMWKLVVGSLEDANKDAELSVNLRLDSAEIVDPDTRLGFVKKLHKGLWEDFVDGLKEEVADQMVLLKLRNALEDKFRYDDNGLPRVWKPSDNIDQEFAAAREHAQKLLSLFSKIDISESTLLATQATELFPHGYNFERTLLLISPARGRELSKRFAREADALFLEAKRAMVSTQNHIPVWAIVVMIILGWNEAMTILFNPVYLILVALVGGAAFVVHNLGLWGPVIRALNGATTLANEKVHDILVEAVNRTEPHRSSSTSRPSRKPSTRKSAPAQEEEIELEPLGSGSSSLAGDDDSSVSH
ncbi:Dynamin-like GTPase that mediates homotypic ER fusion [Dipsacomyces acuminosporus]|nr:Dynamin-like GTPase that mediates homotypic ER fusion [Dipsacomyces acuminosporus]